MAGANEFWIAQKVEILHFLSYYRINNCIVVSQEHYVPNKELNRPINVKDVDTDMKLGVYTWFPYQSSDNCNEMNDVTLLDSWVISAQGHFTKNTDLFPVKIGKSFNRCPMQGYVIEDNWDLTTNYVHNNDSNRNVGMYIKSLEYELLRVVFQEMSMTYVHVSTPEDLQANY